MCSTQHRLRDQLIDVTGPSSPKLDGTPCFGDRLPGQVSWRRKVLEHAPQERFLPKNDWLKHQNRNEGGQAAEAGRRYSPEQGWKEQQKAGKEVQLTRERKGRKSSPRPSVKLIGALKL